VPTLQSALIQMPTLMGTEVSLIVDGERLSEYKVEQNGNFDVNCYVPSETGKVLIAFESERQ
jgi:hypothetical protein